MKCKYCSSQKNLNVICDDCLSKPDPEQTHMTMISNYVAPTYVRGIRRGLDMKQHTFAAKLGVSANTVARWETGAVKPSPESIDKLLTLTKDLVEKNKGKET